MLKFVEKKRMINGTTDYVPTSHISTYAVGTYCKHQVDLCAVVYRCSETSGRTTSFQIPVRFSWDLALPWPILGKLRILPTTANRKWMEMRTVRVWSLFESTGQLVKILKTICESLKHRYSIFFAKFNLFLSAKSMTSQVQNFSLVNLY